MNPGTSSFKTATGTLASAVVASSGTFTISYPARSAPELGVTDSGDFYNAFFHQLSMGQATLTYPKDFDLTFGTGSITVTNKTAAAWPSGSAWIAQFDEPGKRVWGSDVNGRGQVVARAARADLLVLSLGAPDTLDADGISASQSISAGLSTNAVSALLNGALAGTNAVTGATEVVLDVPRGLQAGWTTTSVMTVVGKDEYGATMVETSASGTSHTGKKAFKVITRIYFSIGVTSATVGTTDVLGLPVFMPTAACLISELQNGVQQAAFSGSKIIIPIQINQVDLLAGTAQQFTAPSAGYITGIQATAQVAVTTGGAVKVTANTSDVVGATITLANSDAAGTNYSAYIAKIASGLVAAGDDLQIVPASAIDTAGALNVNVIFEPLAALNGTLVTGMTTAGGSTGTTADVRGTYDPSEVCSGAINIQLLVTLADPGNRGSSQYAVG